LLVIVCVLFFSKFIIYTLKPIVLTHDTTAALSTNNIEGVSYTVIGWNSSVYYTVKCSIRKLQILKLSIHTAY